MKIPRTRLLVVAISFGLWTAAALPASAHYYQTCALTQHDSTDVKVMTKIDHPSTPYHQAFTKNQPRYSGTCGVTNIWWGTNVRDIWLGTYAEVLLSGTYYSCSTRETGWKGSNGAPGDWYTTKVQNSTWWYYNCYWDIYPVRSKALGKAQFADGHVVSRWAYNSAHPHI